LNQLFEILSKMSQFIFFVLIINLIGFILMGLDKSYARKHSYRISEKTLFSVALLGGSLGIIIGMFVFNHKTRKAQFIYGLPILIIVQVILIFVYGLPLMFV